VLDVLNDRVRGDAFIAGDHITADVTAPPFVSTFTPPLTFVVSVLCGSSDIGLPRFMCREKKVNDDA
jgi:hypothetical protein